MYPLCNTCEVRLALWLIFCTARACSPVLLIAAFFARAFVVLLRCNLSGICRGRLTMLVLPSFLLGAPFLFTTFFLFSFFDQVL